MPLPFRQNSVDDESIDGPSGTALLERLRRSEVYGRYGDAFERATGMPVWFEPASPPADGAPGWDDCANVNPFCRELNSTPSACRACAETHASLQPNEGDDSITRSCFAGLRETAVPVWLGRRIIGRLRTGQAFAQAPQERDFEPVAATLRRESGLRESEIEALRRSFLSGPVMDEPRYEAVVELLVLFAAQLSHTLEQLTRELQTELPAPVAKASEFLRRFHDRDIPLDDVARVAGLSPHHLCAVFKAATGMTTTEFVNRERILEAKKRLLSRYARVSEVALEVGFGSLSQFNRTFARYAGESPTEYRRRLLKSPVAA